MNNAQYPGSSRGTGGVVTTFKPEGAREESHYYNPKKKVMTLKEVTFGLGLLLFLCTPRKRTGKINASTIIFSIPWISLHCSAVAKFKCKTGKGIY